MIQTPSIRQLRYFLAVADTLSFGKAANACNVTQSTLSGGLKNLESLLGEKLFERSSRDVALTPIGHDMVDAARKLVIDAEDFVQKAQQKRAPLSGPLSLGVIPTIAPYLLPGLLPNLQNQYQTLQLNLREDLTARLLDEIRKGVVDVALMAFPYDAPDMDTLILWQEPFFMVSKTNNAETRKAPIALNELNNNEILLLDDGHCLRDHAIAACRLTSSATRKTFGATSLPTLIQMVRHGYGITLLPEMAVRAIPMEGLTIRGFSAPQPSRQVGLAWRKGSARAAEFKLLGKLIVKMQKAL